VCVAEVNTVTSYETELSFDYYSLPVCQPVEGVKKSQKNLNIGTLLMGQKIQNSPYNFTLMVCAQPLPAVRLVVLSFYALTPFCGAHNYRKTSATWRYASRATTGL
jgi:hypothetical protein